MQANPGAFAYEMKHYCLFETLMLLNILKTYTAMDYNRSRQNTLIYSYDKTADMISAVLFRHPPA